MAPSRPTNGLIRDTKRFIPRFPSNANGAVSCPKSTLHMKPGARSPRHETTPSFFTRAFRLRPTQRAIPRTKTTAGGNRSSARGSRSTQTAISSSARTYWAGVMGARARRRSTLALRSPMRLTFRSSQSATWRRRSFFCSTTYALTAFTRRSAHRLVG